MKNAFFASLSLIFLTGYASAQDEQEAAQPSSPAPTLNPPRPPENPPPPPAEVQNQGQSDTEVPAVMATQPQQPGPSGQWVYTDQYGWVWMPYGAQYVYEPAYEGAYPYSYLYYPASGWLWVASPWVWGWGPWPYFGVYGPRFFVWYSRPGFYGGWGHRWPHPGFNRGWGYGYRGGYGGGSARWGNGQGGWGHGYQGGWGQGHQAGGFRGGGGFHRSAVPGVHGGGGGGRGGGGFGHRR